MKAAVVIGLVVTMGLAGCTTSFQHKPRADVLQKPEAFTLDAQLRENPAWVPFKPYFKRLVEEIQNNWDQTVARNRYRPPEGSWVTVKFVVDSGGRIDRIVDVDNQSSDWGARACVSAITSRSSYGDWTPDMKASLGEEQELTFTFHYR